MCWADAHLAVHQATGSTADLPDFFVKQIQNRQCHAGHLSNNVAQIHVNPLLVIYTV